MNKLALYEEISRQRRLLLLPPMSKGDFIASLSSLEARGFIETHGNEVVSKYNVNQEVDRHEYASGN